jgi:hypothetical protein
MRKVILNSIKSQYALISAEKQNEIKVDIAKLVINRANGLLKKYLTAQCRKE